MASFTFVLISTLFLTSSIIDPSEPQLYKFVHTESFYKNLNNLTATSPPAPGESLPHLLLKYKNIYNMETIDHILKRSDDSTFPDLIHDEESQLCKTQLHDTLAKFHKEFSSITSSLEAAGPGSEEEKEMLWAIRMASTWNPLLFPSGISGQPQHEYEQCLAEEQEDKFRGRYCRIVFKPRETFPKSNIMVNSENGGYYLQQLKKLMANNSVLSSTSASSLNFYPSKGICFPSKCTHELIVKIFDQLDFLSSYELITFVTSCYDATATGEELSTKLEIETFFYLLILGVIAILLVAASTCHLFYFRKPPYPRRLWAVRLRQLALSCSLYKNACELLNMDVHDGGEQRSLRCVNGIRVLSMIGIIFSNTFTTFFMVAAGRDGGQGSGADERLELMQPALNSFAHAMADTLFTTSAILTTAQVFKLLMERGRISSSYRFAMFYLRHFIRLIPSYAIVIGFVATLQTHFIPPGPNSNSLNTRAHFCRQNWWQNLLYINTLLHYDNEDTNEPCLLENSWYLANDMQYFLICPILVTILFKWERLGVILLGLLTLAAMNSPFITNHLHYQTRSSTQTEFEADLLIRIWNRAGPYLIGIWTEYICRYCGSRRISLHRRILVACWAICSLIFIFCFIFGLYHNVNNHYTGNFAILVVHGCRYLWSIAISWVIYACGSGYGPRVNRILGWKPFIPLERISYAVYLVTFVGQLIFYARLGQPLAYDFYFLINVFISQLLISYLIGFLFALIFQVPFLKLANLFMKGDGIPVLDDGLGIPAPIPMVPMNQHVPTPLDLELEGIAEVWRMHRM